MDTNVETSPRVGKRSADEKFVEVMVDRKYVPHHVYEVEDGVAKLVKDESGNPILQKDVVVDVVQDKFGRAMNKMKEIFDHVEPGTKIHLQKSEAIRLLEAGVVSISKRSFD